MVSMIESKCSELDALIVGASLSGINTAYRLQTEFPDMNYAIVESRDVMGGTWDLFKYPGIRSDSDFHTFGFPWRPWEVQNPFAEGHEILRYLKESAVENGIDTRIQYRKRVIEADWKDQEQLWTVRMQTPAGIEIVKTRFVIWGTGYFSYENPRPVNIVGMEDFKGQCIHPQIWPEDLDYTEKKVALIGSGATAYTLLPKLSQKAAQVTMIQRTPSYVIPMPTVDPLSRFCNRWLPRSIASRLTRLRYILLTGLFFLYTQQYPNHARKYLRQKIEHELPPSIPHDPHFSPSYNVWTQRLCVTPDGDFFKALRSGKADIVTDTIKCVTGHGVTTNSGKTIDADIIITATGLQIEVLGGAKLFVNGIPIQPVDKTFWNGMMLSDLPNTAVMLGYENNSWTLGIDTTAKVFLRLLTYMKKHGYKTVTPRIEKGVKMQPRSWSHFSSTYLEEAKGLLPRCGDRGPWKRRQNYLKDYWTATWGSLTKGLDFEGDKQMEAKKDL